MSLADTLLAGFSDTEPEIDVENSDVDVENDNISYKIDDLLMISEFGTIKSIEQFVPILNDLEILDTKLTDIETENNILVSSEEQEVLKQTNEMIVEIHGYFNTLSSFIRLNYNSIWSDLSNIIKNPLLYIKLIQIINFDILSFKKKLNNNIEEFEFLSKDQILSLSMSLNFLIKSDQSNIPTEHIQNLILEACSIIVKINTLQLKFRNFISKRVEKIAPNLTALIGSSITSQLLSNIEIETLCSTPACNLSSVGKATNSSGYVYQIDIVKNINKDFQKQAIRQICSKIVLAARIDLSISKTGNMDNSLGLKWRKEIENRLEKLMLPPENVAIKPLTKPIDKKSKRRGGQKFKKMRERMMMSEVEKAQNKMIFGEEEVTKTNAFGEEIGLGMLGKVSVREIGTARGVHLTKGSREKIEDFKKEGQHKNGSLTELL